MSRKDSPPRRFRQIRCHATLNLFFAFFALIPLTFPSAGAAPGREAAPDRSWAVVSGPARDIRFEPLSRSDGISNDAFYQVLQDRRGFLWFTTLKGLVRYDGYQHVLYPGLPMVRKFGVHATPGLLHEAQDGTLFVGSDVLSRFDPSTGVFTQILRLRTVGPGSEREVITGLLDGPPGKLWVTMQGRSRTRQGLRRSDQPALFQVDLASQSCVPYPIDPEVTGGQPVTILSITRDSKGKLWLGTSMGLMSFDPLSRSFRHYPNSHRDPRTEATDVAFNTLTWDADGNLWVHVPGGLERFDPRTGKFDRFIAARFYYITPDLQGRLWLWGGFTGLKVFDPSQPAETALKTVSFIGAFGQTLDASMVDGLGVDRRGNVWASPQAGTAVHRYSPSLAAFGSNIPDPGNPNSLSGGEILGIAPDGRGSIWIASNLSGINKLDLRTRIFTRFGGSAPAGRTLPSVIRSISVDRAGAIWIGAEDGTIGRFDPRSARFTPVAKLKYPVTSIFEDSTGRFWIGSLLRSMTLLDRRTGAVTEVEVKGGFFTFEDRQRNLWFSYGAQLTKLDPSGQVRIIPMAEATPDRTALLVRSAYEDSNGILWLATNVGLYAFDPRTEKSTVYSTQHGLPTEELRCMLPDRDGNLWMSTAEGISRFSLREKSFQNYNERDGLQGRTFSTYACYAAGDGQLFFGGSNGFNAFYPRNVLARPEESQVVLTGFQVNGKEEPTFGVNAVRLPYRRNNLLFEFAVLNPLNPGKIRYRFKLEGKEKQWTEVDVAHRQARYTDVPPGGYVFRAEASSDGVTWNPSGVAMPITVVPPWWGTPWAQMLAVLLSAGVLMGVYKLRIATLEGREQRLAALVDQRTAELARARDQAEAASRAKSAFLSNISHELRTPLNAILGFSNLLRQTSVTGHQREQLDIINRSGEHLLALIDDVLDVAKIEAGKEKLDISPCDLTSLVQDVTEMMRVRAHAANLEFLSVQAPGCPRYIKADEVKLRQILINLLGNAIKFTQEGRVTLWLSSTAAKDDRVMLLFQVEDTGIGVQPEDHGRIFEPFVQSGHTASHKGTGLGLTITRRFVELMGGTISLDSEPGRGSKFTVSVPVEPALASEMPAERFQAGQFVLEAGQPEKRVLIVDDNPENAMVLEQMMRRAGFQVQVAKNGLLGVTQFQQWRPDFIWMDVGMPVMDGAEATKRIRELEGGRDVKIAAMTASAFQSERAAVMASGVDDFICKPYRESEVFECMNRHLGVRFRHDPPADTPAATDDGLLRPEALAGLPVELRRELMQAVVALDKQRIRAAIDEARGMDATLASAMLRCAERLDYTTLLNVVEKAENLDNHRGDPQIM